MSGPSQAVGKERTEKVVEQLAAVFVGVEAIVKVGAEAGVNMAVVEFAIENQEDLVCTEQ